MLELLRGAQQLRRRKTAGMPNQKAAPFGLSEFVGQGSTNSTCQAGMDAGCFHFLGFCEAKPQGEKWQDAVFRPRKG
jgi:hypothetical protein